MDEVDCEGVRGGAVKNAFLNQMPPHCGGGVDDFWLF